MPQKEKHVAPLAEKGAAFIDGEVSGTPGMVSARKAVIYLGGDAEACKKLEPVVKGFADLSLYFGPFGAASKVKLVNNLLVAMQYRRDRGGNGARAQGRRRRRPHDQGDRERQRRLDPVRHPRALDGAASLPAGAGLSAAQLAHYFDMIGDWADSTGTATPLLDRADRALSALHRHGSGESHDVAAMVDVINSLPRKKA